MAESDGLVPFERHSADVGLLEESAAELLRLSNHAIDQERATMEAFNPATQSWDGIAAPELRSAPDGVQQDAFEVSSAVAWGAMPLRAWAASVTTFNGLAAQYEADCVAELAALTMPADPAGSPNVALAVDNARATTRMYWERQWQDAYEAHIVDAAETVARMYREGPTEENLRVAALTGGVPQAMGGALLVFPALWHEGNVRPLAAEAVELAERIIREEEPSRYQLARLEELLAEFGGDPAFAYHLLSGLGPDGLLELTADVALIQPDYGPEMGDPAERELAGLVGSIQAGLGMSLATATRRSSGPEGYVLDDDWQDRLLAAGPELVDVHDTTAAPFGYQVLGVLLRSPAADYDTDFLVRAGGQMLDFELEHWHASVPDVWSAPNTGLNGIRLNWIQGYDEYAPNGQDPISGLMFALDNDQAAARAFFSTESRVDGESINRVNYLLSERSEFMWALDMPPEGHPDHPPAGGVSLAGALTDATRDSMTDDVARQIMRDVVVSVSRDGLEVESLRAPLAETAAQSMAFLGVGMSNADPDGYARRGDVAAFLEELGKDGNARRTLVPAASLYGAVQMDGELRTYVEGTGLFRDERDRDLGLAAAESRVGTTAEILRAISGGEIGEIADRSNHHIIENFAQAGRNALDLGGPWGASAGLFVDAFGVDDALANHFDNTEQLAEEEARVHAETRDALIGMFWAASERNGGLGAGEAIRQLEAAEEALALNPGDAAALARKEEAQDYLDAAINVGRTYVDGTPD